MISIKINNVEFFVKSETSIIECCKYLGIIIPRFCYHETLSVAGNCRMCLVEIENLEKSVASCVTEIEADMSIHTNSSMVKKARENVVESLLLNHPLDCPICDQGGECDLQDQTKFFGKDYTRFFFNKRGVENKSCGPLIKTIMTRCIHCTRCVRFSIEIAGIEFFGTLNRGVSTEIGGYISKMFNSEISGNVIDLCPVGALTAKSYAFKSRAWELRINENLDLTDSLGSNIYLNFKESEVFRVIPKTNDLINKSIISDKTRFSYDFIKNNRIKNLFEYDNLTKGFQCFSWPKFYEKINSFLKIENSIQIIVNSELSLETLDFLKKLEYIYLNKIKLRLINKFKEKNNFYLTNSLSTISDITKSTKICFLLSVNPKLESAILNTRLRSKFYNETFNIFSVGQVFSYNLRANFITLTLNNIFKIFEGKIFRLSKLLNSTYNPLILFGENLYTRVSQFHLFLSFIKAQISNSTILKISGFCNSESISLLNILNLSTKEIKNSKNIMAMDLDDLMLLRKYFQPYKSNIVWLNTHGSKIATKAKVIAPLATPFETEEVFLNLEQRPQKTHKILSPFLNTLSIKNIFVFLFDIAKKHVTFKSSFLNFLFEIVNIPIKFELINKKLTFLFLAPLKSSSRFALLKKYPIKSIIENFYCSNKITKNSSAMLECYRTTKKNSNSFV